MRDLTRDEWLDWLAFNKLQPIGDERYDKHVGLLRQTIAAAAGVSATLDDCTPIWHGDIADEQEAEFVEQLVRENKRGS